MKMRYERAVKEDAEIEEENTVKKEFAINPNVGDGAGSEA